MGFASFRICGRAAAGALALICATACSSGDDGEQKSDEAEQANDDADGGANTRTRGDSSDDDATDDESNDERDTQSTESDDSSTDDAPDDGNPSDDDSSSDDSSSTDPQPTSVPPNSSRDRLPESLTEACMAWCDAQYAVDCYPRTSSIEICDLQCVAVVSTQRDFCIEEYTGYIGCLASGGYECVQETPIAKSTCAGEVSAYSECTRELPCKLYCAQAVDTGCTADFDACLGQCIEDSANDDLSCEIRQDSYVACLGQLGASCNDDQLVPVQACIPSMFDAADCRNDGDVCTTWCEGEELLGCGTATCLSECQQQLDDPTCGFEYERVLDCGIRYGYVTCTDDGLVTQSDNVLCDSEVERYAECLEPPAP